MTKRNRYRGGNRAQDVDQEAAHHNHNRLQKNIQTSLRFEAHAPRHNQYRSAGFNPFVKQSPQHQPRQDRPQHQTARTQIHRRLDDELLLLKSRHVKKSLLHHLTQALTEVERWNIEDKLGNDDMDWQPESEVVIPQIDLDVVYSYGKPASSPSSSEYSDSSYAKPTFNVWGVKDTDCDLGRDKTASRLSSGPVHTLYSWGPPYHGISTTAHGCGATVGDCAKGIEIVANPKPAFSWCTSGLGYDVGWEMTAQGGSTWTGNNVLMQQGDQTGLYSPPFTGLTQVEIIDSEGKADAV